MVNSTDSAFAPCLESIFCRQKVSSSALASLQFERGLFVRGWEGCLTACSQANTGGRDEDAVHLLSLHLRKFDRLTSIGLSNMFSCPLAQQKGPSSKEKSSKPASSKRSVLVLEVTLASSRVPEQQKVVEKASSFGLSSHTK